GIAGGADVILIPEIPYDIHKIAEAILARSRGGKRFSIVGVSEGAIPKDEAERIAAAEQRSEKASNAEERKAAKAELEKLRGEQSGHTLKLAAQLEELTGLESRVTILGYLQRGGAPSAADRLLATRLGTAAAELINKGQYGYMVAARGDKTEPVELQAVAGKRKVVPTDHPWVESARRVSTNLGD
ncbi:MAG: 6-phosphofructokinase, partial [Chloroflexi bacterium]|nr:6-phosphofructokinase [Chloroflexota bacterium]